MKYLQTRSGARFAQPFLVGLHTVSFSHWHCEKADLRSISYITVIGKAFWDVAMRRKIKGTVKVHAGLRCVGNSSGDENGSDSMKEWEIIADNLSKAGWSWGCVSALDSAGRTIWITDAHRDDGKRFVVRAR